jgi:excisionase family DNA binding protein
MHLRLIRGADGLARVTSGDGYAINGAANGFAAGEDGAASNGSLPKRRHARDNDLLMPSEVAALFRVSPKTVARWTKSGRLTATRTRGGHHRFDRSEVLRLLQESGVDARDA